jgi:hypothetical protein
VTQAVGGTFSRNATGPRSSHAALAAPAAARADGSDAGCGRGARGRDGSAQSPGVGAYESGCERERARALTRERPAARRRDA